MYTLRIITPDHIVTNQNLGDWYTVSRKGSPVFEKEISLMGGSGVSEIEAFVHGESNCCVVVAPGSDYYVMTESGKTFERL